MISDDTPLCCCEYFDVHHERNHILACCCNCRDFDEGFDSFISGKGIPERNRSGLMATLQDRCRVPWAGGARQIKVNNVLPLAFISTFLLLATIDPLWTVFSGCAMLAFLSYLRRRHTQKFPKSKFFYKWTISSFIVLYLLFEFVVINFLEILWEENVTLTTAIVFSVLCFWKVKSENGSTDNSGRTCNSCQVQVPTDSEHVVWLDCCVGSHNKVYHILGLISAFVALLYHINLTLTSVCLPQTVFGQILVPSDCSDVYDLFELRLSFVSALYSLVITVFILLTLIRFCFLLLLKNCLRRSRASKGYIFV